MANHDRRAERKASLLLSHHSCSPMLEQLEPRLLLSSLDDIGAFEWNTLAETQTEHAWMYTKIDDEVISWVHENAELPDSDTEFEGFLSRAFNEGLGFGAEQAIELLIEKAISQGVALWAGTFFSFLSLMPEANPGAEIELLDLVADRTSMAYGWTHRDVFSGQRFVPLFDTYTGSYTTLPWDKLYLQKNTGPFAWQTVDERLIHAGWYTDSRYLWLPVDTYRVFEPGAYRFGVSSPDRQEPHSFFDPFSVLPDHAPPKLLNGIVVKSLDGHFYDPSYNPTLEGIVEIGGHVHDNDPSTNTWGNTLESSSYWYSTDHTTWTLLAELILSDGGDRVEGNYTTTFDTRLLSDDSTVWFRARVVDSALNESDIYENGPFLVDNSDDTLRPRAYIDSVLPRTASALPGDIITFQGRGRDLDDFGTTPEITGYQWVSDVGTVEGKAQLYPNEDGEFGGKAEFTLSASALNVGVHKIKLRVIDNDGEISEWSWPSQLTITTDVPLAGDTGIFGTVKDEWGQPIPDAYVKVSWVGGDRTFHYEHTNSSGRYTHYLTPDVYSIEISAYDEGISYDTYEEVGISVSSGEVVVWDVTLHSVAGGSTIRGRVLSQSGQPVSDASVKVISGPTGAYGYTDWSDASGMYELSVPPGDHVLEAKHYDTSPIHGIGRKENVFTAHGQILEGVDIFLPTAQPSLYVADMYISPDTFIYPGSWVNVNPRVKNSGTKAGEGIVATLFVDSPYLSFKDGRHNGTVGHVGTYFGEIMDVGLTLIVSDDVPLSYLAMGEWILSDDEGNTFTSPFELLLNDYTGDTVSPEIQSSLQDGDLIPPSSAAFFDASDLGGSGIDWDTEQLFVDGDNESDWLDAGPYVCRIDLTEGNHNIVYKVSDRAGNEGIYAVSVHVASQDEYPAIVNLSPSMGAVGIGGNSLLEAIFSTNNGTPIDVSSFELYIDGFDNIASQATVTQEGFSYSPSSLWSPGVHSAVIRIRNTKALEAYSYTVFSVGLPGSVIPMTGECSSDQYPEGAVFDYHVRIDSVSGIAGFGVAVQYDPLVLEAISVTIGDKFQYWIGASQVNNNTGYASAAYGYWLSYSASEASTLFTVRFRTKEATLVTTISLQPIVGTATLANLVGQIVPVTFSSQDLVIYDSTDTTAPVVTATYPDPMGYVRNPQPEISMVIDDASPFGMLRDSVRITLDGTDVTEAAKIGTWYWSYDPSSDLLPGEHAVEFSCTDITGNRLDYAWNFFVDSDSPVALLLSPLEGSVIRPGEVITLTVTDGPDGVGVPQGGVSGALGGTAIDPKNSGGTGYVIEVPDGLEHGLTTLYCTVTDRADNRIEKEFLFVYDLPLGEITTLQAIGGDENVELLWEASGNVLEFAITRANSEHGPYEEIVYLPAREQEFTDREVSSGNNYWYKLSPRLSNGAWGSTIQVGPVMPSGNYATLQVSSQPEVGVNVNLSPSDSSSLEEGNSPLSRLYAFGTEVQLTCPSAIDGYVFSNWMIDGVETSQERKLSLVLDKDKTAIAIFVQTNRAPATPENMRPHMGQVGVPRITNFSGSSFSDPDLGDTHYVTRVQVRTNAGSYDNPIWDSGNVTGGSTSLRIPQGLLTEEGTYWWRCRYQDNGGISSSWSNETRFTTEGEPAKVTVWNESVGSVLDGLSVAIDLGFAELGHSEPSKAFTVRNDGEEALFLGLVTVPDGFHIIQPQKTALGTGEATSFTVGLSTDTKGSFAGDVSFANNDSSANPFNFLIVGTVTGSSFDAWVDIGDGQAKGVIYTDTDGTTVTASLKGGTATLRFVGDNLQQTAGKKGITITGDNVALADIAMTAGGNRASLTFKTKGGDGLATVDEITGSTALGKLSGKTIDLVGGGIMLTGGGYIGSIQLHDIKNGADIILPGTSATRGITIKAGQLYADTDIVLGSYLKSLTAVQWVGSSLTAPWASKITIKGDRRNGIAGDFGADLTLTGADPKKGISLNKLKVAGKIVGSQITLAGGVGTIMAAQWDTGSLDALWAKNIKTKGNRRDSSITGDFGADLTLTGADPKKGISLNKLQVAGTIVGSQITLAGGVGTIMAAQWDSGSLDALWAKNIKTKGNRRDLSITGNFGATLNLTGQDTRGISLNKLQVAGTALNSTVRTRGSMGSLLLRAVKGSDFLAGIADTAGRYASGEADFVNSLAAIKSVKIKGWKVPKGEIAPRFFENSNFSAASLGSINLLNVEYGNGDEPFGLFALDQGTGTQIKSIILKDTITGEKWKWPVVPVGDEIDYEVRVI